MTDVRKTCLNEDIYFYDMMSKISKTIEVSNIQYPNNLEKQYLIKFTLIMFLHFIKNPFQKFSFYLTLNEEHFILINLTTWSFWLFRSYHCEEIKTTTNMFWYLKNVLGAQFIFSLWQKNKKIIHPRKEYEERIFILSHFAHRISSGYLVLNYRGINFFLHGLFNVDVIT